MKRQVTRIAAAVTALALAAGGGAAVYSALDDDAPTVALPAAVAGSTPVAQTEELSAAAVYERAADAVVEITTTTGGSGTTPLPGGGAQRAQGSGFVYDEEGHIVTNQHVVDDAETVSVRFANGETREATVVGTDPSTDLAVLNVEADEGLLVPLELVDSSALAVGDPVIAIGSPFGLEGTLTAGIVSALGRQIEALNGFTINETIQTDAAINHGNSGGPLLDLEGRVVGVNAQIMSDSGGNDGVGFAIPSDTVRSIAGQLLEDGTAEHAYLGVGLADVPASAADELGLAAGAAITDVRGGSPAADAGLAAATGTATAADGLEYPTGGDVVTELDGGPISSAEDLQRAVGEHRPGDSVTLTVVRDGETREVELELAERPS